MKTKILIIAGPTAVGKTSFSLNCAEKFNGEIISADSIQIYKHLDIGSAKATQEERSRAVHHLIDVIEPDEEFSVTEFKDMAEKKIEEIAGKGKLPIIVGGTGLFIKSLLFPMSFGNSQKDEEIREKYQKFLEENGSQALHNLLEQVDKESADAIEVNNTRRVIRALEIYELTGTKKSDIKDNEESKYDYKLLFLTRDRQEIYDNINRRVDIMMSQGLENEVRELVNTYHLTPQSQSMQAIGYKEFFDYFNGKCTLEEVVDNIKKATRHYAKRQITFFKKVQGAEFVSVDKNLIKNIENWLKN